MLKKISDMKKIIFALLALISFAFFLWGKGSLKDIEKNNIKVFEKSKESVVYISTSNRVIDYATLTRYNIPKGSGSGFIWDKKGHIVTNFHVIAGANSATVKLYNGKSYKAYVVGMYPRRDIVVLKINAPAKYLKPIKIGNSSNLKVGQIVYAIGNPYGLDWTMTKGIISALNRKLPGDDGILINGAIQTDAAINPGNSGGIMLDINGKTIGVNSLIYSPSGGSVGIGFAIPIDFVKRVVNQLIKYGKYIKPSIGIEVDDRLNEYLKRVYGIKGVAVVGLIKGTDAFNKGLIPARFYSDGTVEFGDIIIKIDGKNVSSVDDIDSVLDKFRVGDIVNLTILRGDKIKNIKIKLSALEE